MKFKKIIIILVITAILFCGTIVVISGCESAGKNSGGEIIDPKITGILINTENAITEFAFGGVFSDSGITVNAIYDSGQRILLASDAYSVDSSSFKSNVTGTYRINITLNINVSITAYYDVTVFESNVIKFFELIKPNKLIYEYAETLDLTKGKIKTTYTDNRIFETPLTIDMVSGFNSLKVSTQLLTINYPGLLENTFSIEVLQSKIVEETLLKPPLKREYILGELLCLDGGKILEIFTDEHIEEIPITATMVSGFDNQSIGTQSLTVIFKDKTFSFDVTVEYSSEIKTVEFFSPPDKTIYEYGSEFSVIGTKIAVIYIDGHKEIINATSDMISGFDGLKPGKQTLTLTYKSYHFQFDVTVEGSTIIKNVELTSLPYKVVYIYGEVLELDGGTLTVHFTDLSTKTIPLTSNMISGFNPSVSGNQTISVIYHDFTFSFDIFINASTIIETVEIHTLPTVTEVKYGESFSPDGGRLIILYTDDRTEFIDITDAMISGFDKFSIGVQILIVTYGKFNMSFNVTVLPSSIIKNIEVTSLPNKLEYSYGEILDVSGGILTVTFTDSHTETINITLDMISGFNPKTVGKQFLTVCYLDNICKYTVEVLPSTIIDKIEVTSLPHILTFSYGEILDISGGKLTVTFTDSHTETINITFDMISGFNPKNVGKQVLTVCYLDKICYYTVEVLPSTVIEKIEISLLPNKLTFSYGESLDVSGGMLSVTFTDTHTETINITLDMVNGFNPNTVGKQTLTVNYLDNICNYSVEVLPSTIIDKIEVTVLPDKLTFSYGESLDVTGGMLTVTFTDTHSETINITLDMISGFNPKNVGKQVLTVNYLNKVCNYTVEVLPSTIIDKIEVTVLPNKLIFSYGESLDISGGELTLTFTDYHTETVNITLDMVNGFNPNTVDKQTLTVNYLNKVCIYTIEVLPSTVIEKIEISLLPNKLTFSYGESLDISGGELTVTFTDSHTKTINIALDMVSGFNPNTVGKQVLTISYLDKICNYTIEVLPSTVIKNIEISLLPNKLTFSYGESLDISGGELTVTFTDFHSETINITLDMVSSFNPNTVGKQILTVNYLDKICNYTVEVLPSTVIKNIEISLLPNKLTFSYGESLDIAGSELTITFTDSHSENVNITLDMVSGFNPNSVGKQVLTVSYLDKICNYTVEVLPSTVIKNVEISLLPSKLTFSYGENLDISGGELTLTFTDSHSETINITLDMISGFNPNTVGKQILIVNYMEIVCYFEIEVLPSTVVVKTTFSPPNKNIYDFKEALDVSGGFIVLTYEDGHDEAIIVMREMITGFDSKHVGEQTLTVKYSTFSFTFTVTVLKSEVITDVQFCAPTKNTYSYGEELNIHDGSFILTFSDGHNETTDLSLDAVSGYNAHYVGEQILTATFNEKYSFTFTVIVLKSEVISDVQFCAPTKNTYSYGEELNIHDGSFIITFSDGHDETIELSLDAVSGYNSHYVGEQILTATFNKKYYFTFTVTVLKSEVISDVQFCAPTKNTYSYGEDLNLSGGSFIITFSDNRNEVVNLKYSDVSGYNKFHDGRQVLTVIFDDNYSFDFTVTVLPSDKIESVTLSSLPNKIIYEYGEKFDLTGAKISLIYSDGREIIVLVTNEMISGYNPFKIGVQLITVNYENLQNNTFTVTVLQSKIINSIILVNPNKLSYEFGEPLDLHGGKILTTYTDNRVIETELTAGMIFGYDAEVCGLQTITVNYPNLDFNTFDVYVENSTVVSLIVLSIPSKLTYKYGEPLNLSDCIITVTFTDNREITIPVTLDMTNGYNEFKSGKQTITVNYENLQNNSFEVTVLASEVIKSIKMYEPDKLDYIYGENLDLSGGKIIVIYTDDVRKEILLTELSTENILGYDPFKIKNGIIITIVYPGLTANQFFVNVVAPESVIAVNKLISDFPPISDVTLDHEKQIAAARTAYDTLKNEYKILVTDYNKLLLLEEKIEELKELAALADAKNLLIPLLTDLLNNYNSYDYSEENYSIIIKIYADSVNVINSFTTLSEVQNFDLVEYEKLLDSILTLSQELELAKLSALNNIDVIFSEYRQADFPTDVWENLVAIKNQAYADINKSINLTEVANFDFENFRKNLKEIAEFKDEFKNLKEEALNSAVGKTINFESFSPMTEVVKSFSKIQSTLKDKNIVLYNTILDEYLAFNYNGLYQTRMASGVKVMLAYSPEGSGKYILYDTFAKISYSYDDVKYTDFKLTFNKELSVYSSVDSFINTAFAIESFQQYIYFKISGISATSKITFTWQNSSGKFEVINCKPGERIRIDTLDFNGSYKSEESGLKIKITDTPDAAYESRYREVIFTRVYDFGTGTNLSAELIGKYISLNQSITMYENLDYYSQINDEVTAGGEVFSKKFDNSCIKRFFDTEGNLLETLVTIGENDAVFIYKNVNNKITFTAKFDYRYRKNQSETNPQLYTGLITAGTIFTKQIIIS